MSLLANCFVRDIVKTCHPWLIPHITPVELELEQRRPLRAFVKSRRQRQEEDEAAAGQDRFKLINGKEVARYPALTIISHVK